LTSRARSNRVRRILAVEDGPFLREDIHCLILGVVTADSSIDQILMNRICVDGEDSTEKVASLVRRSGKVDVLMLPSISLGGFNIIDPYELHRELRLPILIVNPKRPDMRMVREALQQHFVDWEERIRVFNLMGSPKAFHPNSRIRTYYYAVGVSRYEAESILRVSLRFGKRPEPLRVARIIARALGELSSMKALGRM